MTTQQVIALTIISAFMLGLFAYAYWSGRQAGSAKGRAASDRMHKATIEDLKASLETSRNNNQRLAAQARALKLNSALKDHHRNTLMQIAENLRIAAETWSAFKTGKKLERDARRLRDEAIAIADLLKAAEQEAA